MPINFYIKGTEGNSQSGKLLSYNIKMGETEKNLSQNIRKFFQCVSYVGCFNLSHIFVHMDNRLYMMNIVPCLESFVREWLQNNPLLIHEIADEVDWIDLRTILLNFLKNKKLEGKVNIDDIIDKVLINKYLLAREYGIQIAEKPNQLEGSICGFPVF